MKVTVLGSGSTGNAVLISSEKTNVLVDAGLSAREIVRRLATVGVASDRLDAILITHEHGDHAGGLRVLLSQVKCPVYISGATEEAYYTNRKSNGGNAGEGIKRQQTLNGRKEEIVSDSQFRIGDIDFEPFSLPHDAVDNCGFVANHQGVRIATAMDLGHFTPLIKDKLNGCDAIVIESNHSRDMLRTCSVYSWDLKQRIAAKTGHLSNEDLADWLTDGFDGSARHIVLTHLSQRANDPHLAHITAQSALKMRSPLFRAETTITISDPRSPTPWIGF
ncbi:MAG: MBL fold metallo-hydrolase [Acidobacteria bacterium]|nr:MBL fold metallo-hydrolase [Acidobacteriota bacterium]